MLYRSHALIGTSAGLSTALFLHSSLTETIACTAVGYLGCLLPDIDHTKSFVSKRVPILPKIISFVFSHRGFTHSALLFFIMYFLLLQYGGGSVSPVVQYAFLAGFTSHVLADCCTVGGVRVLWPTPIKISFCLFKTGSKIEFPFAIMLSVIFVCFSRYDLLIPYISKFM